jgi:hypothetical protein
MFPRGAPGFALFLLRVSLATSVLLNAGNDPHRGAWLLALAIPIGIALCAGFLTPIAALLTIPVYLVETAGPGIAPAAVLTPVLQAIALSLLGPGSYSIDAYHYGRRIVVLPQKDDRDAG